MSDERHPLDGPDTDWGREQERRHQENTLHFQQIDATLDDFGRTLKHEVVPILQELRPVVNGMRAAKKGGKIAQTVALIGSQIARIGIFLVGIGALLLAIFHGESWSVAWKEFWNAISR